MVLMFPLVNVDHRASVKGQIEVCIILNHLFHERVAGTLHLLWKDEAFLSIFVISWSTPYSNENGAAVVI